ncbi:MAG: carbohydrate kinase family protein [Cyclobacteriaceae bacterium]
MSIKKTHDVLVAGELNVDIILNRINKFPALGKEVLADQMTITLGSSSAIFASNLSVLGTKVAFAGTLARDHFGELILASLQSKGVDTSHIVFTNERSTGATIALNFEEDRAMLTYPGAIALFSIEDISEMLLAESRHLHVSSIFLSTGLKKNVHKLFRKARALGLTTSLDPQWDPHERWDIDFKSLLPDVDVFIPNENELRAMTGIYDIHKAVDTLKDYANILIVKSGRDGALLWKGKEFIHQPAFLNNEVVDSIGAGDSFGAGFIHQFIQGKTLKQCLEFGALTGAINTTRAGGTSAFENLDTVKAIAESEFNYKI